MRDHPPDQAARDRIRDDLGSTLFVEAGAGSGKTTALVSRLSALVVSGSAELRSIAAITFTEKAGVELRDRVRRRLEELVAGAESDEVAARCRLALDQLDGSAIGTLHSFAQRLLNDHPLEAGLPPRLEVLDEITSGLEFERRWTTFREQLLADPSLERTLRLLLAAGVKHDALRTLALEFDRNWDLVDERVPLSSPEPPPVADALEPVLRALDGMEAWRDRCGDPADGLCVRLDKFAAYAAVLRAGVDEFEVLALLDPVNADWPGFAAGKLGSKKNWTDIKAVRVEIAAVGRALDNVRHTIANACAERLASVIRGFTVGAAGERRAAGRLEFHDLLVLARSLLTDEQYGPAVRAHLHDRYPRLLLDEFQDTDPIQIELAVRIAADDPGGDAAGRLPWLDVETSPGQLFVVGDPKQSIYRFRRADIATFLRARDRLAPQGGGVVELTTNFRTGALVIDWVNGVFEVLFAECSATPVPTPSQPDHVALTAIRPSPPSGPPVAVLGRAAHPKKTSADGLRAAEAAEVVATVVRAVTEGWMVANATVARPASTGPLAPDATPKGMVATGLLEAGPTGAEAGAHPWRPAQLGDITILVPSRTSLPFLEDEFDAAGVAFRAESSSLVYATRAVRDLLMVLRAVDDPTDEPRTVAALRTPLLGCGDDDLFRFKVERGGRWNFLLPGPDEAPADDPVVTALAYLRELHDERRWRAPSELLERISRDRRALELGFADRRPRDVWRRLRFVIDQARSWSDVTGGGLRRYLQWVDQQTAEGARVAEAVLPETDDDAVRIMTIHAAKGLEFPITILSGMSTVPQGRRAAAEVVFSTTGRPGYRFGNKVVTEAFEAWQPIDEQMAFDERVRLLYVAATRARDHLVVSVHRKTRVNEPATARRTNAEVLVAGMAALLDDLPDAVDSEWTMQPPATPEPPPPLLPLDEWRAERDRALRRASTSAAVAATALTDIGRPDAGVERGDDLGATTLDRQGGLETGAGGRLDIDGGRGGAERGAVDEHGRRANDMAAGLRKRPPDLDLPPWMKGRYGTAVGRAVHGVLQTVDLATGAGLDDAVAVQCEAEAVTDRARDVAASARQALASVPVREAARSAHWREVYACAPVDGGRLLEGYIDLLYRTPAGLVVVDYKTAAATDAAEFDRRVSGYRLQGASYALAVASATGESVVRVTFVFLTPHGAVVRDLPDLAATVEEVRALVRAGAEVVTA